MKNDCTICRIPRFLKSNDVSCLIRNKICQLFDKKVMKLSDIYIYIYIRI